MVSKQPPSRPAPRFYLATPPVGEIAAIADALASLIGAADVAAVLLRLAPADERTLINRIKQLAPIVQRRDVALIVNGHPAIVARAGADGCHLSSAEAMQAAAASIKPDRILGAGGLTTRHDAMLAAEAGADYVMFGEPEADGARPSFAAIVERVTWWAEVFQVPCVAWAEDVAEVEALCVAGADFIALGEAVFADPRKGVAALAEAAKLSMARAPA